MIRAITNWMQKRRAEAARHARALQAFKRLYPDRSPVAWRLKEHVLEDGRRVQTICYGNTKPPSRSFWIFSPDCDTPKELAHEQAKELFEVPVWR